MNVDIFRFYSCGTPACSNYELECGGNRALIEMSLELGFDLQDASIRRELNEFFAQQLGPDRVVIVEWPRHGFPLDSRYDYSGVGTTVGACPFLFRRTKEKRVSRLVILALVAMRAGMRIAPKL